MVHKRRLSTPLVLLWALAQGMWMGAGWHASSQMDLYGNAGASSPIHVCACARRIARSHTTQITPAQNTTAQACAVCQVGILAPEVPATFAIATIPPSYPARGFAQLRQECSIAPAYLPPSRAPPVA